MNQRLAMILAGASVVGLAVVITLISAWDSSSNTGQKTAVQLVYPLLISNSPLAAISDLSPLPSTVVEPVFVIVHEPNLVNVNWDDSQRIFDWSDRVKKMHLLDLHYEIDPSLR